MSASAGPRVPCSGRHPNAPPPGTPLCALQDIPDGGACQRSFGPEAEVLSVLLLRRGEQVWAYLNRCPHFSIPLDFEPGVFWTYDAELLMCAHHGALFRFEDGQCVDGPCQGSRLTRVSVRVEDTRVRWTEP